MTADVILQFIELGISLAQSENEGADAEQILLDIISKGVQAYHDSIGKPVDPMAVGILSRV